MGRFGGHDDNGSKPDKNAALEAEIARLEALPLPDLAELMLTKEFQPGTTVNVTLMPIGLLPEDAAARDAQQAERLGRLAAEALQALQNGGLLAIDFFNFPRPHVLLTRAGEAALAQGTVAAKLRS